MVSNTIANIQLCATHYPCYALHMKKIQKQWDVLNDAQRQNVCNSIIGYFATERDEAIGTIVANEILDIVLETSFGPIYNSGLNDARKIFEAKSVDVNVELDYLPK